VADDSHSAMMQSKRAAAVAAVIGLCLLAATSADARRPAITGSLDRPGYTLVALGPDESSRSVRVKRRFKLVPPARTVTLQLRDRSGALFGPVVIRGRGKRVVVGVRAGAKLGLIRILNSYATPARKVKRKWLDLGLTAKAPARSKAGKARRGKSGNTPSPASVGQTGPTGQTGAVPSQDGLAARNDVDDPTANAALVVAIAAAAVALLSLLTQAVTWIPRRRGRVDVDVGLALPVYQNRAGEWTVFIELVNKTEQPIRWTEAELELKDGRLMHFVEYPRGGELPAVVEPGSAHRTWASCTELERNGLGLHDRVVAVAKTAGGETFRSKPTRLRR
jgi:hypothetical protein